MIDSGYVLRADEIPDDLWAVIEPVLLPPLAGRRVLPWNDHRLPLEGKNPVMTGFSLRAARIQLGVRGTDVGYAMLAISSGRSSSAC